MTMAKASYRGDPGIFGFIGKAARALGGVASVLPGVGGIAGKALKVVGGIGRGARKVLPAMTPARTLPIAAAAGIPPILRGAGRAVVKGAKSIPGQIAIGTGIGLGLESVFGGRERKKYRRMNATNPKALKRAIRRVVRFGEVARSCGYSKAPKAIRGCKTPTRKKTCR
ncbi:MAG TPA: hypothetical protein VFR23_24880 [Jiangellaceae bacterium]|nr:hypothetical protein [Jiangellaceae bacterium]